MANIALEIGAPTYKILTAGATLATSTYDLSLPTDNSGKAAMNILSTVYDIDLTLGNMVLNLPYISTLMTKSNVGLGLVIKGTITAISGTRTLVFRAPSTEGGEVNTICGLSTATIVGAAGTGFFLTPVGSTNWMMVTCDTTS